MLLPKTEAILFIRKCHSALSFGLCQPVNAAAGVMPIEGGRDNILTRVGIGRLQWAHREIASTHSEQAGA
jgi:hypothetical protein